MEQAWREVAVEADDAGVGRVQTLQPKDTPVDFSWKEIRDLQEILDDAVDAFQLVEGVRAQAAAQG